MTDQQRWDCLGVLNPLHRLAPQYAKSACPTGERWISTSLSLPIYPLLEDEQAGCVAEALRDR
jgi:dTDP-4-amino-4,6-dideoxygalactose transaminase